MSQYGTSEAEFTEVSGPEVAPWTPTPGSDARPPVGVAQQPVSAPPPQIDIDRIRDDFEQDLNQGTDYHEVPVPGVTRDNGKPATVTVPLTWTESRKKAQAARLQRWLDAQDRLGAGIIAHRAARLQQEIAALVEEGKGYVQALHSLTEDADEAGHYSYESYSHPLDDIDIQRHRGQNSWTSRVRDLEQRVEQLDADLELSGYEHARRFYLTNSQAAERARETLFGAEDIDLPPAVDVPTVALGELSYLVNRSQKMVDAREKVRRFLYDRHQIRTEGTPIDLSIYTSFKDRF